MTQVPNSNVSTWGVPWLWPILLFSVLSGCGGDKEGKIETQVPPSPATEMVTAPMDQVPAPATAIPAAAPLPSSQGVPEPGTVNSPLEEVHISIGGNQFHQAGGDFSLLVGSFVQNGNAMDRVSVLEKAGFRTVKEAKTVRGQKYYRVHLRGIKSYNEAQRMGSFIEKKFGFDYLVLQR